MTLRFTCLSPAARVATALAVPLLLAPAAFAQTAGPKKAPWEGPPCSKEKTVVEILLPKPGQKVTTKPGQPPSTIFQGRLKNVSCATGMTNIDPEGWKVRFFVIEQSTKKLTLTPEWPVQNGYVLFKADFNEEMLPAGALQATFRVHGQIVAPFTGPPFLSVPFTVQRQFPPATFPNFGDIVVAPTIISPTPNSVVMPNLSTWPGAGPVFTVSVQTTIPAQQCAGAKIQLLIVGATGYSPATGPVFPPEGNAPAGYSNLTIAKCAAGTKTLQIGVHLKPPFKATGGWLRARASQINANGGVIGVSQPTQFKLNVSFPN